MGNQSSRFFPDPPRTYRGMRWVKVVLRAVHVLCAGVLTGAYLLEATSPQRESCLIGTVLSGLLLFAADLYESAAFLLQVRGAIVLLKLALLALLPVLPAPGWVLAGILSFSVISSHAPSAVRYRMLFGRGRIRGAETKG